MLIIDMKTKTWKKNIKVKQLVNEYFNVKSKQIKGDGSIVFGVQTKFESFLLVHLVH
jgi:hypothetical protein